MRAQGDVQRCLMWVSTTVQETRKAFGSCLGLNDSFDDGLPAVL